MIKTVGKLCPIKAFGKRSLMSATLGLCFVASAVASANGASLSSGVYSKEQADKGKAVYEKSCKNCHDAQFYEDKLSIWQGQPVIGFFDIISTTMPADNPASLMYEDYVNVLAYIFSELGFPAGDKALNPDDGSMEEIIVVEPK